MGAIRELDMKLTDWEARYVLESLSREMERLRNLNAQSDDEDEAADAGNDYLEICGLFERMSSDAALVFGAQILNFGSEII